MAVVAACLGVMAAAAALLPCPDPKAHGARLVLCLLAIESVLLAVASPFLAARGSGAWLRLVFAPLAAVPLLSLVLCAVASRGNVPLARLAWCQAFLLAFACLVAALTLVLRSLRLRDSTAQAAATVVALLMLGQVFFANALVEVAAPGRQEVGEEPAGPCVLACHQHFLDGHAFSFTPRRPRHARRTRRAGTC